MTIDYHVLILDDKVERGKWTIGHSFGRWFSDPGEPTDAIAAYVSVLD